MILERNPKSKLIQEQLKEVGEKILFKANSTWKFLSFIHSTSGILKSLVEHCNILQSLIALGLHLIDPIDETFSSDDLLIRKMKSSCFYKKCRRRSQLINLSIETNKHSIRCCCACKLLDKFWWSFKNTNNDMLSVNLKTFFWFCLTSMNLFLFTQPNQSSFFLICQPFHHSQCFFFHPSLSMSEIIEIAIAFFAHIRFAPSN